MLRLPQPESDVTILADATMHPRHSAQPAMSQVARVNVLEPVEADRMAYRAYSIAKTTAKVHPIRIIDRIVSSLPSAAGSGPRTVATV